MSLKDVLNAPAITEIDVDGIGVVRFRYITTKEALALPNEQFAVAMLPLAVVDEEGKPVFADLAAVQASHWLVIQKLLKANESVNFTPDAAAKK